MKTSVRYIYPAQVQEYDEDKAIIKVLGIGFGLPERIKIAKGTEVKVILEIPQGELDAKP